MSDNRAKATDAATVMTYGGADGTPMSAEDVLRGIQVTYEVLRQLRARLPQSDWHAAFEAVLRIAAYEDPDIEVRAEVELGVDPPRADYLVLRKLGGKSLEGDVYALFRDINVVEFKGPDDAINLRAVFKAIGYASILFGNAMYEGDVHVDQVTVSLFHPGKKPMVLKILESMGAKIDLTSSGVYQVEGISYFPVQIVAMDELEGPENAIFRALSDHAKAEDIRAVAGLAEEATGKKRELYNRFLKQVFEKNVDLVVEMRKEDGAMPSVLMDIMKDDIDLLVEAAVADNTAKVTSEVTDATWAAAVKGLMSSSGTGVDEAMDALGVPQSIRSKVAELAGGDQAQ